MHELSLCEDIRRILCAEAERNQVLRITAVHLRIGTLSCVEPDALRFCFEPVMAGSVAEGARLVIAEVPARARCRACAHEFAIQMRWQPCPLCDEANTEILDGMDMHVAKIEAETADLGKQDSCGV